MLPSLSLLPLRSLLPLPPSTLENPIQRAQGSTGVAEKFEGLATGVEDGRGDLRALNSRPDGLENLKLTTSIANTSGEALKLLNNSLLGQASYTVPRAPLVFVSKSLYRSCSWRFH